MAVRQESITIIEAVERSRRRYGRLMIFGRPSLLWEGAPSPEEFYRGLGYEDVHSLDISPYQGATFVHDLNNPVVPAELCGRYDFVSTGGTIEHIFNWQSAVQVAFSLLKIGGTFLFSAPVNNWVDHGFYQFSPTLKFDYFAENEWRFGASTCSTASSGDDVRRFAPLYPGEANSLNNIPRRVSHTLEAIKTEASTVHRIPTQSLYARMHEGVQRQQIFHASEYYESSNGALNSVPMDTYEVEDIKPFGKGYRSLLQTAHQFSIIARPFRSKALLYEDNKLLNWIVSDPRLIGDSPGSFAHFNKFIYLTASDGSDPRTNGRRYEIRFLKDPNWLRSPVRRTPLQPASAGRID